MVTHRLFTMEYRLGILKQTPASNGRFGASGGVLSADNGWVTSSFALVRAFAIPPPASSRGSLWASDGQCGGTMKRKNEQKIAKFAEIKKT